MRINDAEWGLPCNIIIIRCPCGFIIRHRSDRWIVRCAKCNNNSNLALLRDKFVKERRQDDKGD